MRSHLAGDFVSQQTRILLSTSQPPVPLVPHYLVESKTPVEAGAPANAVYRKFKVPPSDSFRRLQEDRVLGQFKESIVQVWDAPGRMKDPGAGKTVEEVTRTLPGRSFEMPDGWNQSFGVERFKVAEGIFDASMALTVRLSRDPMGTA